MTGYLRITNIYIQKLAGRAKASVSGIADLVDNQLHTVRFQIDSYNLPLWGKCHL